MKKPPLLTALALAGLTLLTSNAANAQQVAAVKLHGGGGVGANAVAAEARSRAAAEETRAQIPALQKRKSALEKHLGSINPASPEYKAVERSIRDLDTRLHNLTATLAREEAQAVAAGVEARQEAARAARSEVRATAETIVSADKIAIREGGRLGPRRREIKIKVDPSISGYTVIVRDKKGRDVYSRTFHNLMRGVNDYTTIVDLVEGDNIITVNSADGTETSNSLVLSTTAVPARAAANASAAAPQDNFDDTLGASREQQGLVGLMVGGVVVSQQAENFSQADPFFGFTTGYSGHFLDGGCVKEGVRPATGPDTRRCKQYRGDDGRMHNYRRGNNMLHLRFTGIFQVQPKREEAPPADDDTDDDETPDPVDPSDLTPFLASRKSFDIEGSLWWDMPFNRSPHVYIGPYVAVGGSTYVDKNELFGDERVSVEEEDDNQPDDANDETELDTTRARIDNDLNMYYHTGLMLNVFSSPHVRKNLFMQTILAYGRYEALAGFNPGKTGFLNDSRNRFIGKLRIFPQFLDTRPDGTADMSPMFGVEINAGRGPDQVKFFTGVGVAFKLFKAFKNDSGSSNGGATGATPDEESK
jgi:hypothetical protein